MISAVIYLIGLWLRACGIEIFSHLSDFLIAMYIEIPFEFICWMVFLDIKERKHRED